MAEKTFLSEGNTVVTSARVTIAGDQYFVNQISTSKVRFTNEIDPGKKFLQNLCIVIAIVLGILLAIKVAPALGIIVLIGGIIAAMIFIKPKYKLFRLYLGMSSGEVDAVRNVDSQYINRIANAINEALASRM
ncbi:MAG: hypothetical protein KAH32_07875 [Chlamydiia bacterium]|nr:hypothetical protein [Chlamydiia bacterium]